MPGMATSVNTADEYDIINHDEASLGPDDLAKVRNWLQPTDYLAESGEFRRHLSSQAPGTGLWICETDEYRRWHDSPDHGSLWIKGIPGAGKSVIAASIIQHLRTTEDCPVLFFFFRNIVSANFSPRALIQDWLAQLLPHAPKLQFALQSRLDTSLAETSDSDLIQLFLDGVSCVPKLYCVGDALDEMTGDNRPFLDKLNGLATHRPHSLKLLMTSRPKQYLQSSLRDSSIVHISLQQRLVDADIISYLRHRCSTASESSNKRQFLDQVVDMVAKRSEGLFLYAKLTMDQIEPVIINDDPVDVRVLEESLPIGLEQTYASMLARQRKGNAVSTELQLLVLEAVTHASRPLRLNELASFLKCVCPDVEVPTGFKLLIVTSCGPLIEVLEDETLQVIHHSFTEFLRGDTRNPPSGDEALSFPIISSDGAHKRMAINCLRYLQSGALLLESERKPGSEVVPSVTYQKPSHYVDYDEEHEMYTRRGMKPEVDSFNYREARLQHPFLQYAVENWSWHASYYDIEDEELFTAVMGFLNPQSLTFLRWLVLEWGSTSRMKGSTEGIPTALHIAAFSGLSELARSLLQNGSSVLDAGILGRSPLLWATAGVSDLSKSAGNLMQKGPSVSALDAQERTPLHWAAFNGHAKVASLLLEHGAAPNPEDGCGLKPIHLASRRNHPSVVTVLLKAGVKPDTIKTRENTKGRLLGGQRITRGETSIGYACEGGHTETIEVMIPFSEPHILEWILCACCRSNRTEAALAVLDKSDVSADAMYRDATALYFACASTNVHIVEALVKRGADVRKTSCYDPERVINGPAYDKENVTAPIHRLIRAWQGNDAVCQAILRQLLKAGADLEQPDGTGRTPLLIAAGVEAKNKRGVVRVPAMRALLDAGADGRKTSPKGDTALHGVLQTHPDLEAVQLLIDRGSDPNQKGSIGETALQCCLNSSRTGNASTGAIARYLLELGADPNVGDRYRDTPVFRAMSRCPEVFPILLSRCNDMAVKRNCWFSLSSCYGIEKFTKQMKALLSEGIDINTKSKQDRRTLYLSCLGNEDKLRVLADHGADPNAVDKNGNNALHLVSQDSRFARSQVEKHVAAGADPLRTNDKGDTLLHHAALQYTGEEKAADYVQWLVSLGIPVNAVNDQGETPLHVSLRRRPDFTSSTMSDEKHFVDAINGNNTVNFEIRDNQGLMALHRAVLTSADEVVALQHAGADLSQVTQDSQNILHLACRARKPNILLQLLETSATVPVNAKDDFGMTPLHYACASGDPELVAFLLKHGADAHAVGTDGSTTLHACATFRTEQTIREAQVDRKSWLRSPPEDAVRQVRRPYDPFEPWYHKSPYAKRGKMQSKSYFSAIHSIIKLLLDADCDVAAVNKRGWTALDVALAAGTAEFVQVFAKHGTLFARATKNLEKKKTPEAKEALRRRMRTQMALMCQRSAMDTIREDNLALEGVQERPEAYLGLLTCEDVSQLLNERLDSDEFDPSLEESLRTLMEPHHMQIVERIPRLISRFSSLEALTEWMETVRRTKKYSRSSVKTPLQLACQESAPNMQTLMVLVEKLHVDVNCQWVACDDDSYLPTANVIAGGTALHLLAEAHGYWKLEAIRYLVARGADVNARDERGRTPLHVAAEKGTERRRRGNDTWKPGAVRVLLEHGADPNILDCRGLSALHAASSTPEIVCELLARGASTEVGASNPLFSAIHEQSLGALEALLDHGLSVDSLDESRHSRAIHYALTEPRRVYALFCSGFAAQLNTSVKDSAPLLRCLVERGADLYLPLNDKETLIHFLFEYPEFEILDTLLAEPCVSRIDFDRRDQRGRTVLMAACRWREVLPGYSYRHWSSRVPGPPLRILDRGADVTLTDNEGKTALHHLLNTPGMPNDVVIDFINREEVSPILLQKDGDGFLPFHYALRILRPAVCELLVTKGANLLEPDPNGLTVLHYIAKACLATRRNTRIPGRLDVDLPQDYFDQCLHLWRKFIAAGGSINAGDNEGNTPLHAFLLSADKEGREKDRSACHLLHYDALFPEDSGVDVPATNNGGESALHAVARREKTYYTTPGHDRALFRAMMQKGLDPLAEDARGRSALDIASACGKDEIVELFGRK